MRRAGRRTPMRALVLAVVLVSIGCVTPASDDDPATDPTTPSPLPEEGGAPIAPSPAVGARMIASMERFVFHENRSIGVLRPDAPELAEARVPEPLSGTAFHRGFVGGVQFQPFVSYPFRVPFETSAEIDITMRFVSSAAAVASTPSSTGFPTVGGWFGTPERFALFVGAPDLPQTLEANQVYTVTLRVPLPKGGFFVREGEQIALAPYINYQSADGAPIAWIVGGPEPASFALPHTHFNLSAPTAIVLVDESGETGPNPAPTGEQNPAPANIAFKVPPEAVYVVLEVTGAPKAGTRIDIDASIRTAGGEVLAAGSSPFAREVVVIGPGALAAAGRDLVARVTSASSASGGAFQLKVTAYAP